MAYICDIIIALVIIVSVLVGRHRGLIKTAFKCLSLAAAILIAYFLGSHAGEFIEGTKVYEGLSLKTKNAISAHFDEIEADGLAAAEKAKSEFSESGMAKTLSRLGLETDSFYEDYSAAISKGTDNAKEKFAVDAAQTVMSCLAKALGTLIVFIAALIALKLLSLLLDGLFKLPVLKTVNKIGGLILGLVFGLVLSFVLCMAVEILLPYIPQNPVIYAGMEEDTVLYSFFLNLNPVLLLLFG